MLKWINDNYDEAFQIALNISKNNKRVAEEIFGIVIDNMIDYNPSANNKRAYYVQSAYNAFRSNIKGLRVEEYVGIDVEEIIDERHLKLAEIRNYVDVLRLENRISDIEYNSWIYYYFPEEKINIKKLSLDKVKKIRSSSYRDLADKSKVNFQLLRKHCMFVNFQIKTKYK